jgi:SAM-dependent methyltransferase
MKQMKRMRTLRSGSAAAPPEADAAVAKAMKAPRRKAAAVFQQDWNSYGKIVANNYLHHREAYAVLRDVLGARREPFRFLDIACGDASASAGALAGTTVSAYHGIDLSEPGLERAAATLAATLPCPVTLEHRDFVAALADETITTDIAWIGLSLHHLRKPQKEDLMRHVRRAVGGGGRLLVYENASPIEESREAWLERWDAQRPDWTAFSDAEWESINHHVHACDHPETDAAWLALGRAAGFAAARCLYASPNELFRLYDFGPAERQAGR